MSETERNALIKSIIDEIIKSESEGKTSEYAPDIILASIMRMKDASRIILNRKGNGIFIIRLPLHSVVLNSAGAGVKENLKITGEDQIKQEQQYLNHCKRRRYTQNKKDTSKVLLDYKKPEFYLKNLPLNSKLLAVSNDKIANALLSAGKAYSEKIGDNEKATMSFEALLTRYPSSELVPETFYNLYKVNKDQNSSKAETYRQRLLEKYPESEYAKILSDPDYYNKKIANAKMAENLYQQAYNAFTDETL